MSNTYVNVEKIEEIISDVSLNAEEARIMIDTIVDLTWHYRDNYSHDAGELKAGFEKIELIALAVSERLKRDKFHISPSMLKSN